MIGISCKCITYGRVEFLEESIKSFLVQEYDGPKELVIVNDYPLQKLHYDHPDIRIINLNKTFDTIGEKENYAVSQCKFDTIAVWDDDDMALPNHLSNINKYFPGNDLLHWNKGIFLRSYKIAAIRAVGNSGIVYSKQIWEKGGKHRLENAGYDTTFVRLMSTHGGKICRAFPPNHEASWLYTWGGGSYHMSGQGKDHPGREDVITRHSRYIEVLRASGKIPEGDVQLKPHWKYDYVEMLKTYISTITMNKKLETTNLNGWAIGEELFAWLLNNIPKGSTILEFGAGTGTIELSKHFNVYSVEDNAKWVNLAPKAHYILSPIVTPGKYRWYDINNIVNSLKGVDYRAIIIDGPNIRVGDREGFIENLKHFNTAVPILIDDTHRALEQAFSNRLGRILKREPKRVKGFEKSFDII